MAMSMSRTASGRGSHLPYRTLAGVVPCPKGWLMASAKLQGITMSPEQPQVVRTFVEVLDYKPAFQVVALFSPVGLSDEPDSRGRTCDRQARALLRRPRSGAVLSAPARGTLACASYQDAREANGGRLSAVGWRMLRRTAEVHEQMAPYWQRTIFEVHPELSFFQLNEDRPVRFSKHTLAGRQERRSLLDGRMPGVERIIDERVPGASPAHLLDAAACLWTARRIIARGVVHLPEHPEWDSEGLRMEFVY
jgi:predicted RNase H-like nuclease